MTRYETWEEFPEERLTPITCTDAPAEIELVDASNYDKLEAELAECQHNLRVLESSEEDAQQAAVKFKAELDEALEILIDAMTHGGAVRRGQTRDFLARHKETNDE
jgi:hypothetical protein